ncbi:MAG: helix-turn-helix domain-containing protein [Thermoanaerobaculia bacterium]
MKSGNEAGLPIQEEVRQLMELVRVVARTLGFSNAALARRANVPLASLVRYFKGEGEPKIEFLLAVLRAFGLEPREFFMLAYPPPATPSPALARIERVLGPLRPGQLLEPVPPPAPEPPAEAPAIPRHRIEQMLEDLRRDVHELMESQAKAKAGADEDDLPRKRNGDG